MSALKNRNDDRLKVCKAMRFIFLNISSEKAHFEPFLLSFTKWYSPHLYSFRFEFSRAGRMAGSRAPPSDSLSALHLRAPPDVLALRAADRVNGSHRKSIWLTGRGSFSVETRVTFRFEVFQRFLLCYCFYMFESLVFNITDRHA